MPDMSNDVFNVHMIHVYRILVCFHVPCFSNRMLQTLNHYLVLSVETAEAEDTVTAYCNGIIVKYEKMVELQGTIRPPACPSPSVIMQRMLACA